jgi:hypothetical protein
MQNSSVKVNSMCIETTGNVSVDFRVIDQHQLNILHYSDTNEIREDNGTVLQFLQYSRKPMSRLAEKFYGVLSLN